MTIPHLTGSLADWISSASPGSRVIVQTGIIGANGEARQATDAGLITTFQKRAEDGRRFHLIACRINPPKTRDKPTLGAGQVTWRTGRGRAAHGITERVADAVRLRGEGLTQTEIAERMDVSLKTVKHYIARAREEGLIE